ncbi:hypothetical protein [Streptomyces sp. NBC_00474]|uniref:hypothetical protein n=1 Tax=Streptomyces sp. NBC_00474 TaxID=2975754 RepID=UPI0022568002|nr:hypothetical protein [Streptomyces sp. NBC_00474]MCX5049383.1 hypothetical protein [Streptomyces sp. NBC_00474]
MPTTAQHLPAEERCRAVAYSLHESKAIPLASHDAASPRLALRWMRERTSHITDQLDAPYAQPGRHWLTDEAEHERALSYLTTGTAYQLTLYDENTRYVLAACPSGGTA